MEYIEDRCSVILLRIWGTSTLVNWKICLLCELRTTIQLDKWNVNIRKNNNDDILMDGYLQLYENVRRRNVKLFCVKGELSISQCRSTIYQFEGLIRCIAKTLWLRERFLIGAFPLSQSNLVCLVQVRFLLSFHFLSLCIFILFFLDSQDLDI